MLIRKQDCITDVNVAGTEEYYRTHTLCSCAMCRNFYAQVREAFPLLDEFLSEFGADIERPDELGWTESGDEINYLFAAYTVSGEILEYGKYEIDLHDRGGFVSITIDSGYVPNEQADKYFTVTVYGIRLLWVLEEPMHDESEGTAAKPSFFDKIKHFFKK